MSDNDDIADDEAHVRPITDFLNEIRRGAVVEEASRLLHELIAAVKHTGKAGRLTLTFDVSEQKNTQMLLVKDAVAAKIPKLERPHTLWFVDDNGNPTRQDPHQLAFEGIRALPAQNRKNA